MQFRLIKRDECLGELRGFDAQRLRPGSIFSVGILPKPFSTCDTNE
jgi:hypothetical protein